MHFDNAAGQGGGGGWGEVQHYVKSLAFPENAA
jgi:hypothetical protein